MDTSSDIGIWALFEAFYIHAMLFNTRAAASIESVSSCLERFPAIRRGMHLNSWTQVPY